MRVSEVIEKIQAETGEQFPISVACDRDGNITAIEYETSWQTGSTESIEDEAGNITYKQDYKDHTLTKAQIEIVEGIKKSILNV